MMMLANVTEAALIEPQNPRRPPLMERRGGGGGGSTRKPKSKQVSSRYMSPSPSTSNSASNSSTPSTRSPSPLVSRKPTPRRSVSADRSRPVACRLLSPDLGNVGATSTAATKLFVTSIRRFSVSFQGETFSLPISKTKVPPSWMNLRKCTPERRSSISSTPLKGKVDGAGDQLENYKPIDQQRWPARIRSHSNPLTKSSDCNNVDNGFIGSGHEIRELKQSLTDVKLTLDLGNVESLESIHHTSNENSSTNEASNLTVSDTDSVSSGSTSDVRELARLSPTVSGSHPISVSARFWPKSDACSPLSMSLGSKLVVPPKFNQSKKFPCDSHNSSIASPRRVSSPLRTGARAASPSKLMPVMTSLPSRGMVSPSRVRGSVVSTISSSFGETPSVLSFAVDVRRGKVGENLIVDAHMLRLLYNRQLVWRFVNAKTEAVMSIQKHSAEKNMWDAWITISNLRDSVTKRRHRLQLLRQKLKLVPILKGHMTCLEDWGSLEKHHSVSLLGAIGALKASTLRLPVIGGATADIRSIKDAIGSAFEVMQALTSSMTSFPLLKVEEVNSLLTDLANETTKEHELLEQCKNWLSMLAAMQVKDCSLRTHTLQHNRVQLTRRQVLNISSHLTVYTL